MHVAAQATWEAWTKFVAQPDVITTLRVPIFIFICFLLISHLLLCTSIARMSNSEEASIHSSLSCPVFSFGTLPLFA